MAVDSWLPIGFELPDGARCGRSLHEGPDWQIVETRGGGRALLARNKLAARWIGSELVEEEALRKLVFGSESLREVSCGPSQMLAPLADCRSPEDKNEALAFAIALKATRALDVESPLQDAIYVEKFSRLLPTYGITSQTDDDVVLGYWLTGGARVSAKSFRRLSQMMTWLDASHLREVVEAAGFEPSEFTAWAKGEADPIPAGTSEASSAEARRGGSTRRRGGEPGRPAFLLPGRPALEAFFNEHVVDIIRNRERYEAMGVGFPSAIVLHGPPGCGKTFAVERLIEYLGWPSFQIEASSVASPFIHETSRKVAEVFCKAIQSAPAVLVIDEMEAFLADRDTGGGGGHHRVEEVAEFLRRIPEAARNEVLIVAMTNRIDMIDKAVLRRGRFDHVIRMDYATEAEVLSLLETLLSSLPKEEDVDPAPLAKQLANRPISDVTSVVREGARLAARSRKDRLDQNSLLAALHSTPAREGQGGSHRRIGFI